MLTDILGSVIAFVSVILLLSIVVTSLVQISQAVLRLRGRNLMKGLAALLVNARQSGIGEAGPSPGERRKAKLDATRILNASNVAQMDRVGQPDNRLHYWILGPKVSWMEPEELATAAAQEKIDIGAATPAELTESFRKNELHMKKRFLRMTRGWSVAWAIVVAVAFQVSAPDLFNELASDPERRDLVAAEATDVLTYHAESVATMNYDLVAPDALETLAARHEDQRTKIEQAIGVGTTRAFVLDELELALEDVPERDALVAEYDRLIDEAIRARVDETADNLRYSTALLRQYDIALWPGGRSYYVSDAGALQWNSILGVLITSILLSFGGAFWFEQLRNVATLRDALAGGRETSKADGNPRRG